MVLFHRDRRFRLAANGDNTYSGVWRVPLREGFHHLGVNALAHETLFDDVAPYRSQAWILHYVVRGAEPAAPGPLAAAEEFMARITAPGFFTIDQWMVQHLCQVLRKADVRVVAGGLDGDTLGRLFVTAERSVEEALDAALRKHGPGARVVVIPEGPYVLAAVSGRRLAIGRAWMDEAA